MKGRITEATEAWLANVLAQTWARTPGASAETKMTTTKWELRWWGAPHAEIQNQESRHLGWDRDLDRGPEVARVEKQAGRELDWSPAFQNFIVTKKLDPSDPVEFHKIR
jgi:hypothetical protein